MSLSAAIYQQNQTGTPSINPMFFEYPNDPATFSLGYQYFYGPALLVAPVTVENSTETDIYLPNDLFYDYHTLTPVRGNGSWVHLTNVSYTSIPLYLKGGSIVAQRVNSANTTAALRQQDFEILIAPGVNGTASGSMYLDDGDSLVQEAISDIQFEYSSGVFSMSGSFGYDVGNVSITSITLLNAGNEAEDGGYGYGRAKGKAKKWGNGWRYEQHTQTATKDQKVPLTKAYSVHLG